MPKTVALNDRPRRARSPSPNDRVAYWAEQIASNWRDSVDAILGVGRMLAQAHAELAPIPKAWARLTGRGKYEQLLPFERSTAERLRMIGDDGRIGALTHQLPADWMAIYLLTTLADAELERAQREGLVAPSMTQVKVRAFKRLLRQEREQAR